MARGYSNYHFSLILLTFKMSPISKQNDVDYNTAIQHR